MISNISKITGMGLSAFSSRPMSAVCINTVLYVLLKQLFFASQKDKDLWEFDGHLQHELLHEHPVETQVPYPWATILKEFTTIFPFYEGVSLPGCVLPCKICKILGLLLKLMKVCV